MRTVRRQLILFSVWLLLPVISFGITAGAASKPNIVVILADDLGIGDVKCYGGDRCLIETPNLDALAAEGIRFTDAHVTSSICGPSRTALMTGRYSWRFSGPVKGGPWGFVGPRPHLEDHTLAKLLKRGGYDTACIGKWHLGTIMTTSDGRNQGLNNVNYTKPLRFGPIQFGFDESFILPGSLDMYPYAYLRNHEWQGEVTAQKGWSAFNRVGPAEKDFKDHEVLETFYREAEDYLGRRKTGEPFFLLLTLTGPHTPTSPGKPWQGRSKLGVYGDFVMEVDHAVKRVRDALKAKGLDDNTLVLFSSDHGPAPYAGNILKATPAQIQKLEQAGHYPSGRYRGYKFSIYEGGLRVPLIAHWPGVTPPGTTCDSLVSLGDFMATFAELTDEKLAASEGPDSISFAPLLKKPGSKGERRDLVMESTTHFAIRSGEWKLCLTPSSGIQANFPDGAGNDPLPKVAWRKALDELGRHPTNSDLLKAPFVQLYDLTDDPGEKSNLAAEHPERVAEMVGLLQRQVTEGRSTPGPKLKNDKRVRIVNLADRRLPDFVKTKPK